MMYCLNNGCALMPSACSVACERGSLELLVYAREHNKRLSIKCMQNAAYGGHLHCMQYLHAQNCRWDTSVCESAVRSAGKCAAQAAACLDCLRFALDNGCPCSADIYSNMAHCVTHPFWECLRDHGVIAGEAIVRELIRQHNLRCLELALLQGTPVPADACEQALQHDAVRILQLLHEQAGLPLPPDACNRAVSVQWRSACLYYVREQGCQWDESTFCAAAKGGCVNNLRYLRQRGCPWDASACTAAATAGSLECLQYLHESGCPWDQQVLVAAMRGYQNGIFAYALENGCPYGVDAFIAAATVSSTVYPFVQILHERGCAWDERVTAAAATCAWNVSNLQYLHEHGCPWDAATCAAAASAGHIDCLRYTHEHGCPYDQDLCLHAATAGAYLCLVYAHRSMGCPLSEQVSEAAAAAVHVDKDCLVYVVSEGCPMSTATMNSFNMMTT